MSSTQSNLMQKALLKAQELDLNRALLETSNEEDLFKMQDKEKTVEHIEFHLGYTEDEALNAYENILDYER
jgi:hypothetical protein